MGISISEILGVLAEYGIRPLEDDFAEVDLPGIGEIVEGEAIYATSLAEVFGPGDEPKADVGHIDTRDARLREWRERLERITEGQRGPASIQEPWGVPRGEPPEPHCAWYCPMHFFGHG